MTLTHYIGGKLTGLTADFPPSLNYPNLTTFINFETFQEFILVAGVWEQIGAVPGLLFPSMYESFVAFPSILKQHFVEWFSGSVLDSFWTQSNITGVGIFEMADEIDGGFELTTGAGGADNSLIEFNDRRHYDVGQCEYITVWRATEILNNVVHAGLFNNPVGGTGAVYQEMNDAGFNNFTAVSNAAQVEGSVPNDNVFHLFRCESTPTNALFSIDGLLDITGAATPTNNGQPVFRIRAAGGLGSRQGQIRYFEAFNT